MPLGKLTLENIFQDANIIGYKLSKEEILLLRKYFNSKHLENINISALESELNEKVYDIDRNLPRISLDKLYQTFLANQNLFNEEASAYLLAYTFNKTSKSSFEAKYPNSFYKFTKNYLIDKLELLYYNIYGYFNNQFTKEQYLKVRDKLVSKKSKLLDLYYGIEGKTHSIEEIAVMIRKDYQTTSNLLVEARLDAIKTYYVPEDNIDYNIYLPYLDDPTYDITAETRTVLKMLIVDKLSYSEIQKRTNINITKIHNIVSSGFRRLDLYRFNILEKDLFTKDLVTEIIRRHSDKFDNTDINIINLRYNSMLNYQQISTLLGIKITTIKYTFRKIYKLYYEEQTKDIIISIEDILNEINKQISESILNDEERKFLLNLLYETYTIDENKKVVGKFKDNISLSDISQTIIEKFKKLKVGLLKPELLYISRTDLDKILDDKHLPLTKREKDILCYLFELKGYHYKSLSELEKLYGLYSFTLKRTYLLIISKIYKYQNNELSPSLDYETEIKTLLKYFPTSKRLLIIDYYQNEMTYEELAKKYHKTPRQILTAFDKIKITLYSLIKEEKLTKKFDYDYYNEVINNPDLPFYGNLELAKEAFETYTGMNKKESLSSPKTVKHLNIDYSFEALMRLIYSLMLSVCKYKDGIRKVISFTFADVCTYYNENIMNMDSHKRDIYEKYIGSYHQKKDNNCTVINIPNTILNDLVTQNSKIKVIDYTQSQLLYILQKYANSLSKDAIIAINELIKIGKNRLENQEEEQVAVALINKIEKLKSKFNSPDLNLKKDN